MKNSISTKLFAVICFLIIFFVLFSSFFNINFLSKYYTYKKKSMLLSSYKTIDKMYKGNLDNIDLELELERLERSSNINIVIQDAEHIKYASAVRFFKDSSKELNIFSKENFNPNIIHEISDNGFAFKIIKDHRLKSNFLNLISVLNNGDILVLNTTLVAIEESSNIANKFFIFTGILTLILGGFLAFIISKRFTRPILQLNEIAKNMSKLDFSKKFYINSPDEIGELGFSINSLSSQLDRTISKLKFANRKLEKDLKRERQIDEMRKEFIANVSHELKTPLFLIQGYSEGLKLNINEEEKNFYCDVIMNETTKMNKLVKQLLELSKLESGSLKLEKKSFDIFLLINKAVNQFKTSLHEKNLHIIIPDENNVQVYADMDRIEQVLVNYLTNAIDHVDDKKQIKISLNIHDDKVRVYVFNSGKHIPNEEMDKIWVSFYKLDKARTRAYGGTGLGLSIVRSIQLLHNNSYGVKNVKDGIVFWFEIDKYTKKEDR